MSRALARMLFIEALKALALTLLTSYRLVRYRPATQNAMHFLQEAESCIHAARANDPALREALERHEIGMDDLLAEAQEKLAMALECLAFVRPDLYVERD